MCLRAGEQAPTLQDGGPSPAPGVPAKCTGLPSAPGSYLAPWWECRLWRALPLRPAGPAGRRPLSDHTLALCSSHAAVSLVVTYVHTSRHTHTHTQVKHSCIQTRARTATVLRHVHTCMYMHRRTCAIIDTHVDTQTHTQIHRHTYAQTPR